MNPTSQDTLSAFRRRLVELADTQLGFPLSRPPRLPDEVLRFLDFNLNNLGDPYEGGSYKLNTFGMEREVVDFFADLFHLPTLDERDHWGYVTSGGSEGNMMGLWLARKRFPSGIVYYSDKSHYSIAKAVDVLGLPSQVIRSNPALPGFPSDQMDVLELYRAIHKDERPVIICMNAGSTFSGAFDPVDSIAATLERTVGDEYHIHVDAALSGLILPFVEGAPAFDFDEPICSMAVSGHKMLGVPIPCGVFLARRACMQGLDVEYIGSRDSTFFGSRSGFAVLCLWWILQNGGKEKLAEMAEHCIGMTQYAADELERIRWKHWRADPASNTIVIAKPPPAIVAKWQLAVQGDDARIVIMPHVTWSMLDAFLGELRNATASAC